MPDLTWARRKGASRLAKSSLRYAMSFCDRCVGYAGYATQTMYNFGSGCPGSRPGAEGGHEYISEPRVLPHLRVWLRSTIRQLLSYRSTSTYTQDYLTTVRPSVEPDISGSRRQHYHHKPVYSSSRINHSICLTTQSTPTTASTHPQCWTCTRHSTVKHNTSKYPTRASRPGSRRTQTHRPYSPTRASRARSSCSRASSLPHPLLPEAVARAACKSHTPSLPELTMLSPRARK